MTTRMLLLVDDDDDFLAIAERAIKREALDGSVCIARSGSAALAELGLSPGAVPGLSPRFVALFVDLNMPGVDGWDVIRRVRADAGLHHLPIVVVSSSSRADDVNRAYAYGASSYIVKRFDPTGPGRYLANAMRYWLDLNQPTPLTPRMVP